MPDTDRSLVTRARAGDSAAFATLLERHRGRLARACGDRDLAQDAALVAWLQLDRLRDPERFGAWLAGIGRMLRLRELRRRGAGGEALTATGAVAGAALHERGGPRGPPRPARATAPRRARARARRGALRAAIRPARRRRPLPPRRPAAER